MSYQCKFCNAVLASEYSLSTHQKKTKKCLIKQGLSIPEGEFKCKLCNEKFIHKTVLNIHLISCNKKNILLNYNTLETNYNTLETKYNILETKYNMILDEKTKLLDEKEKLLDKITTAALSKTNTNKNTVNITTYTRTDDELKHIYENNLNSSHIEGGIFAITKLIVDKVITDVNGVKMITITDKARGTARYKLPSGEDVVDNGLNTFTTKNRDILMRRICSLAAGDIEISNQILDVDTTISKGYTEITDDVEGYVLRSSLIKSI
jgi:regulator of replication initiation timing